MMVVTKSGTAMAAAALSLAVTGLAFAPAPVFAESSIQCFGVNACKGQGACKTASSSCKGQNACKGQGWITASSVDCATWGGKEG